MNKSDKKLIIGLLLFTMVFISYIVFYRVYALKEYEYTEAVYKGTDGSAWGKTKVVSFKTTEGELILADIDFNTSFKVGDTVKIKYSTFDPTIIELIEEDNR